MLRCEEWKSESFEPEKIGALIHIVENDLGYFLFRSVEKTKLELSSFESTAFAFTYPPVQIEKIVARVDFENWIRAYLKQIANCYNWLIGAVWLEIGALYRLVFTWGLVFCLGCVGILFE